MFFNLSQKVDPQVFAANLRRYRKKAHLTQAEVGKLIGLSLNSYYRWEQGANQKYGGDKLDKLCALFNCTLDDLFNKHTPVLDHEERIECAESETSAYWVKDIKLFKSSDFANISDFRDCKSSQLFHLPEVRLKELNNFFAFEVPSATMEAYQTRQTLPLHSIVICSTKFTLNALNEVPVVYSLDGNTAGVREYNIVDDKTVSLRAWNEHFPPLEVERERVTVFGVVKKVIIEF